MRHEIPRINSLIKHAFFLRLNQESSQNQAFDNSGLNLEEELNRRYTQYTPEPEAKPEKKSKGSLKSPK